MEHDEDEEPPLAVQIQQHNNDESISQQSSVGVTLITGYLGAGKSTVTHLPFSIKINTPLIFPFYNF